MSPFDDEKLHGARAVLVKVLPDQQGRFQFEIWARYTRPASNQMQVGDLVSVENYTPPSGNPHLLHSRSCRGSAGPLRCPRNRRLPRTRFRGDALD